MSNNNVRRAKGSRRRAAVAWLVQQARPCWMCGLPIGYDLPHTNPRAFNCDELEPVSKGGSPYAHDNLEAAHACCNNWRSNKSVTHVFAVRARIVEVFGSWKTPEDFVAKAKAVESGVAHQGKEKRYRHTHAWL